MVDKVLLVLPHSGAVEGICIGFQDASMVSLQVLAIRSLDRQLVIITELQQEIHRGVAAADH